MTQMIDVSSDFAMIDTGERWEPLRDDHEIAQWVNAILPTARELNQELRGVDELPKSVEFHELKAMSRNLCLPCTPGRDCDGFCRSCRIISRKKMYGIAKMGMEDIIVRNVDAVRAPILKVARLMGARVAEQNPNLVAVYAVPTLMPGFMRAYGSAESDAVTVAVDQQTDSMLIRLAAYYFSVCKDA